MSTPREAQPRCPQPVAHGANASRCRIDVVHLDGGMDAWALSGRALS